MDYLWNIVLGAVQGITEFLPVSSSGHLSAAQLLMRQHRIETVGAANPMMLEILLHLATLLAVLLFYRKDVVAAVHGIGLGARALFRRRFGDAYRENPSIQLVSALFVGTIPTGIIGFLLKDIASDVSQEPLLLGICFLVCAVLLASTRLFGNNTGHVTLRLALIIGIVQGIAVFPGISRSGMTIATALALHINREEAVRFSFLLSIPAILGAAILEFDAAAFFQESSILPIFAGALCAFACGLGALVILVRTVKSGRLWAFSPYVAAVGILCMAILR